MSIKIIKTLFSISLGGLFVMAFSILLMPLTSSNGATNTLLTVVVGLLFWIGAIVGYILMFIANYWRRKYIVSKLDGNVKMGCKVGIFTFFTDKLALIADVVMVLSFMLFVVFNFTPLRYEYISYVLLFLLILSCNMHCVLNGRVYKFLKNNIRRREG